MTATRNTLPELLPTLLNHIKAHYNSHIVYNSELIDICNGNLLKYVKDSLKQELNPRAYDISKNRIPPINVLKKLQIKLSKVYGEDPTRTLNENVIDNELFDTYLTGWDLNEQLSYANDLLIINKYCALEPYIKDGEPKLRVLSAKDFIVYSDSVIDPTEMTVFIKFMGTINKKVSEVGQRFKSVSLFHAYSDNEFIIFDEEGDILEHTINPHGIIPFIYIRSNQNELIPTPDSDNLPMVTLIPRLLTDLNYAVLFGARSQIVGIDIEVDDIEFSPDSMWILNSVPGENKSPSLSTIKSDVDVEKVITLISTQLAMWLDTKGIKTGSIGKATIENAASGISKLIDESDASAVNRQYKKIFVNVEKSLFKNLPTLHNTWINTNEIDTVTPFSSEFKAITELVDAQVVPNNKALLEEFKIMDELGIFYAKSALQKLNPEMDDDDIEALLLNIEEKEAILIDFSEDIKEDNSDKGDK